MNDKLIKLCRSRDLVAIFRGLAQDEVFHRLMILIGSDSRRLSGFLADYSDFVSALYNKGTADLSSYLLRITLEDENIYIKTVASGEKPPKEMQDCLLNELSFLQEVSQLKPEDFAGSIDFTGHLPRWSTSPADFVKTYQKRLAGVGKHGYGKWARSDMFIFRDGEIVPLDSPDPQRLSDLFGYEEQRRTVLENTRALIAGKPALNALLYGDAGTGKSSTVKAIVNELAPQGLRLIELTKEQLRFIPEIISEINTNPLKFIIFIDDLSFNYGEDCFSALKATLEGSAASQSQNMVIYATSNRCHLVKETFSDRSGDDIHANDTMQETLSLSARFGLRVSFGKPGKDEYIAIAAKLAKLNGVIMNKNDLAEKAEQFALSSGNGRSPRTAKQFVYHLLSEHTR